VILVSVIIPVYNTEKYLRQCLDSVRSQTLQNIEIICINDGSTDNSLIILEEYQKTDARIKILNKKNQGVSKARNAGLEIAQGKYIGYIDSDDTIEPNFFQKLFETAEKYQAESVYSKLSQDQNFDQFPELIQREDILKKLLPQFLKEDKFNSVCNKIFLNKIIKEDKIVFPEDIKNGEDAQFNIEFLVKAERISFLDYCGYIYREVEGSATRDILNRDYLERAVEVYKKDWKLILNDCIPDNDILNLKKVRFVNNIISLVYIYGNAGNGLSLKERFLKLRNITHNITVNEVFSDITLKERLNLSSYKNTIFDGIKNKSVFKLYLLTLYSYYKNK
jgi:glycosyltransferase involved in cell wall biosynthesis